MAEGTLSKQIENKILTQISMVMQEVMTEFQSWMDSLEASCATISRLVLSLMFMNYEEKCKHIRILQITLSGIQPVMAVATRRKDEGTIESTFLGSLGLFQAPKLEFPSFYGLQPRIGTKDARLFRISPGGLPSKRWYLLPSIFGEGQTPIAILSNEKKWLQMGHFG